MIYCINPECPRNSNNSDDAKFCKECGSELLLDNAYRVVKLLRERRYCNAVYEVVDAQGNPKILKVLKKPEELDNKIVRLFKQEAEVLSKLNHEGIPKAGKYFAYFANKNSEPLHCLVMEKIEGVNLEQYIRQQNSPISEKLAITWLIKLANILDKVHEQNLFHRDIKPSNIMLRSSATNQEQSLDDLVLIDFGAVREVTDSYVKDVNNGNITRIYSHGYAAPEVYKGQASPKSDFFALGRTFIYLLTGVEPCDFPPIDLKNKDKKDWRPQADISKALADFLDKLMEPLPENRPQNTKEILRRLAEIQTKDRRNVVNQTSEIIGDSVGDNSKNPVGGTVIQYTNSQNNGHNSRNGNSPGVDTQVPEPSHPDTVVSKRNRPWKKLLAAAGILIAVTAGGIIWNLLSKENGCSNQFGSLPLGDNISCGEEIIFLQETNQEKEQGVDAIAAGKYDDAVKLLLKSWNKNHDPETLIYLNNARIDAQKVTDIYTFAVVAPITNNPDSRKYSEEILDGVAQAQDEFNKNNTKKKIKILIASDNNNPGDAKKIAQALVKKNDVLGVIGHFTSDTTIAVVDIYQQHKLLLISPTATSVDLSNVCKYNDSNNCFFHRVSTSDSVSVQGLTSYMLNRANKRKAAIFYNPGSNFSKSSRDQMQSTFPSGGGKIVAEFDFLDPSFNAEQAIKEAEKKGADVLVLFPNSDGLIFNKAFQVIVANQSRYPIVGTDGLYNTNILAVLGNNAQGIVVGTPWHYSNSPNVEFTKAAKNMWGENVYWRTASGYDATRAFLAATETLPSKTREGVQQAMANPNFTATGATGKISFKKNGDRQEQNIQLVQITRNPNTEQLEYTPLPD